MLWLALIPRQSVPLSPKQLPGRQCCSGSQHYSPQTVNSQAVSTDPQWVSTSASQAGSSWEDSTSQAASANSQSTSIILPQAPPASRQPNSTNTPWGSPRGNSLENPNPKWVINLFSKPLTQAQRSVLAKSPNFAVIPRHPPNLEYITAIEATCTKLGQQDAEECRAEINSPKVFPPTPNLI